MLPLMLAALSANISAEPVAAASPARATVTIVRGAEIRFSQAKPVDESMIRTATVREPDGSIRRASLIEFY